MYLSKARAWWSNENPNNNLSDLAGKKIVAVTGTTNEQAVIAKNKQMNLNVTIVSVKDRDDAVAAVEGGSADAFASDKLLLVGAKFKTPDAMVMLPDDLSIEPYAIALPRGDWAMRLAVNTPLAQIYRNGDVLNVFNKWFAKIGLRPSILLGAAFVLGGLPD